MDNDDNDEDVACRPQVADELFPNPASDGTAVEDDCGGGVTLPFIPKGCGGVLILESGERAEKLKPLKGLSKSSQSMGVVASEDV